MNFLLNKGLSAESSPRKPHYDELLAELAYICINKSNPTKNVKSQKKTSEDTSYTTSEVNTFVSFITQTYQLITRVNRIGFYYQNAPVGEPYPPSSSSSPA